MPIDDTQLAHVGELIDRGIRQLGQWAKEADTPLSKQQMLLLRTLHMHGQMITVSELAAKLGLTPSATTIAVERLVQAGCIVRKRDDTDRRVVWIQMSDQALKLVNDLLCQRTVMLQKMFSGLSEQEVDTFIDLMVKMISNMEQPAK